MIEYACSGRKSFLQPRGNFQLCREDGLSLTLDGRDGKIDYTDVQVWDKLHRSAFNGSIQRLKSAKAGLSLSRLVLKTLIVQQANRPSPSHEWCQDTELGEITDL